MGKSDIFQKLDAAFEEAFGKDFRHPAAERMHERMHGISDPVAKAKLAAAKTARMQRVGIRMEEYAPSDMDIDENSIKQTLVKKGFILEKPNGSCLHHALDEFKRRGALDEFTKFWGAEFQSFVIQHDWAAAFDHASDFQGGDVRLPFDFTAFEFKITGSRVVVCLGANEDGTVVGTMYTGVNGRWYIPCSNLEFRDGKLIDRDADGLESHTPGDAFLEFLSKQIHAVCVVLEAEVAESEVVRAPHKLQERRRKEGKVPMKDYHVVSLAHRHRVSPPETSPPSDRKRPRCHYRRGHWRHFADHRTWIKWMLVGNPDLGFVDKEYRL